MPALDIRPGHGYQRIELAIAAKATDIVSSDKDLLSLPTGRDDAAKRFRQRLRGLRVLQPGQFVRLHSREIQ